MSAARFAKSYDEKTLQKLVQDVKPKNTVNKTRWAMNVFNSWKIERSVGKNATFSHIPDNILNMTNYEINECLCYFVAEVKNVCGQDYYPNSLYELITSIQLHLRENDRHINLLEDNDFVKIRKVLDARMKELTKSGLGTKKKQAETISIDQENKMWTEGILGEDNPQKLLDTIIYLIGLNFALRAGKEHRDLRVGENTQCSMKIDIDGMKTLTYTQDVSKCNPGGLAHRKIKQKTVSVFQNEDPERCLIRLYEKYMKLR